MSIIAQIPVIDYTTTVVFALGELNNFSPPSDSSESFPSITSIFNNATSELDAAFFGTDYIRIIDCSTKAETAFFDDGEVSQIRSVVPCPDADYARKLVELLASNWDQNPFTVGRLFVHTDEIGCKDGKRFLSADWKGRL